MPAGFDGSAELPGAALGSRAEAEATLPHAYLLRFLQLRGQARKTPGMSGFGVHNLSVSKASQHSLHDTKLWYGQSWYPLQRLSWRLVVCPWPMTWHMFAALIA